jgi:D-serine deaminase-like pyridoxal phosphate-dependent protein
VDELTEKRTPFAWLDLDVLERNCQRMLARSTALGVRLRPHVKTHKTVQGARLQLGAQTGPITVSTMAEARGFFANGFNDITYALPISRSRMDEVVAMNLAGCRLAVLLDHPAVFAQLQRRASAQGAVVPVYLEIDCGYHRSGLAPGSAETLDLAQRLQAEPSVEFCGLITHAGQSYGSADRDGLRRVAEEERKQAVAGAERLRSFGVEVREVSVGSTPTMSVVDNLSGVTEIRPGNYALFDLTQMRLGSCSFEDIALRVRASVIGRYPDRSKLVIDAGALALSKDLGPRHLLSPETYGTISSTDTGEPNDELRLVGLSQEHGHVEVCGDMAGRWEIGSTVDVVPNHSCLTAACFDRYAVSRRGEVVDEWRSFRGW